MAVTRIHNVDRGDGCKGCIPGHGDIALYHDGLLATTGTQRIEVVDRRGAIRRTLETRLAGNHLMDFTLDRRTGELYAVGPRGYTGRFSTVTIATGRTRLLVRPDDTRTCGERGAVAPGSMLVEVSNPLPVAQLGVGGSLLFARTGTGRIQRTVDTPGEAVDVVISAGQ